VGLFQGWQKKKRGFFLFFETTGNPHDKIYSYARFFPVLSGQETCNPGKNHKKMLPEGHFPRLSEGYPPTFVPAVNRKRARVDGPSTTP
jgi:hypothetical protein